MNSSTVAVNQTFAPQLKGEFTAGPVKWETVLTLNTNSGGSEATIAPGAFTRREYVMDVPGMAANQVVLAISNAVGVKVAMKLTGL